MFYKNKLFILIILFILCLNNSISKNKYKDNYNNNNKIKKKYIYIKNNVFIIKINKNNNKINKIFFLKYKNNFNKNYKLINNKKKEYIINNNILLNIKKKIIFKINKIIYKNNKIILISEIKNNNIIFIKYIIFNKDNYKIFIKYFIKNNSKKNINIYTINKLIQKIDNNKKIGLLYNNNNFIKSNLYNINNKNIINKNLNWISIFEKYFIVTFIPLNNIKTNIFIKKYNNLIKIGYKNSYKILPKKEKYIKFKLWIGPKLNNILNKISPKLDLTIEYGKLWFLSKPLFKILSFINSKINNWGYSIIILTFLIKIVTHPLNKIQYKLFLKIKKIEPEIKKIKKKYSNNNKKINYEIIKLYKKWKINPFINLFIIISQIPIFISIYNLLIIPIELKNSKFIFWIKDLSNYDRYYILPIFMSITIYFLQKNYKNNNNNNINNNYINIIISSIFTIFFLYLPSGLLIYYIINNILNIIQQKIIENKYKNNF